MQLRAVLFGAFVSGTTNAHKTCYAYNKYEKRCVTCDPPSGRSDNYCDMGDAVYPCHDSLSKCCNTLSYLINDTCMKLGGVPSCYAYDPFERRCTLCTDGTIRSKVCERHNGFWDCDRNVHTCCFRENYDIENQATCRDLAGLPTTTTTAKRTLAPTTKARTKATTTVPTTTPTTTATTKKATTIRTTVALTTIPTTPAPTTVATTKLTTVALTTTLTTAKTTPTTIVTTTKATTRATTKPTTPLPTLDSTTSATTTQAITKPTTVALTTALTTPAGTTTATTIPTTVNSKTTSTFTRTTPTSAGTTRIQASVLTTSGKTAGAGTTTAVQTTPTTTTSPVYTRNSEAITSGAVTAPAVSDEASGVPGPCPAICNCPRGTCDCCGGVEVKVMDRPKKLNLDLQY